MNMPSKLKESTKEYKRDRNNRMTNQYGRGNILQFQEPPQNMS